DLHNLLAGDMGLNFFVGEGFLLDFFFWSTGGDDDLAAKFSFHLDGNLDFFFFWKFGNVFWPGGFQQIAGFAEHLPELVGEVGSEGSDEEDEVALDVGKQGERELCGSDIPLRSE